MFRKRAITYWLP